MVLGGVQGEFGQEFAGGGVDDADLEVLGEGQDVGSSVDSADADGCGRPFTRSVTTPV
ncbi:hypothetical protein [Kribbella sp. NBC_00359]|uniref:hypothetical protein n=1 Tax=Kribbella sp. NBC_00359 TaxID=2975966 RepID=UPI002E1E2AEC